MSFFAAVWDEARSMARDGWVGWMCLSVITGCVLFILVLLIGLADSYRFSRSHDCIDSGTVRVPGRMVGVVGRGGHYQPAHTARVCYEWRNTRTGELVPYEEAPWVLTVAW